MYDDNDIGPLDCEEIEGYVDPNSDVLMQCVDAFEKDQRKEQLDKNGEVGKTLQDDESSSDEDDLVRLKIRDNKEKWDCESILSTYSNIYNHPKLITEPKSVSNPEIENKIVKLLIF